MEIVENENTVFFDIDDTLILHIHPDIATDKYEELGYIKFIDSYERGIFYAKPSKKHIKLLKDYDSRGFFVIAWSGNGFEHARNVIEQLNLFKYVDLIMTKPRVYVDDLKCDEWMGTHIYLEKGEWFDKT